jgi:hypothetical protein
MKIARMDIENCTECPAYTWSGENCAIPRQSCYYCRFTHRVILDDRPIPADCPLRAQEYAPELLKALKELYECLAYSPHPDTRWEDGTMTAARAAIAKAEGTETPDPKGAARWFRAELVNQNYGVTIMQHNKTKTVELSTKQDILRWVRAELKADKERLPGARNAAKRSVKTPGAAKLLAPGVLLHLEGRITALERLLCALTDGKSAGFKPICRR